MGIIKQGILGGFSKKVGAVVGTSWKGIAVMKSMPQSVVNPKTTAQVEQRSAFAYTSKIASALLTPCIQECWNRWAKRESGYNAFVKKNVGIIKAAGQNIVNFCYFGVFSDGELTLPNLDKSVTTNGDSTTFTVTWDTTLGNGKFDKATDIVKIGAIMCDAPDGVENLDTLKVVYADSATRDTGEATLVVTPPTASTQVGVFAYVVSADGYFRSQNLGLMNA